MPHLLIAGKMHPAGLALLHGVDDVTYDYVEEVSEPSYAPLISKADGLVIRTQPLSAHKRTRPQPTALRLATMRMPRRRTVLRLAQTPWPTRQILCRSVRRAQSAAL